MPGHFSATSNDWPGTFEGAEEALIAAAEHVDQGVGDPYEEANVLSMTASLLTDLGQLEEAADLLEDAAILARSVRDRFLEGRPRIKQTGNIAWVDPAQGFKLAEHGLSLLRRSKIEDRHTELGGLHIMAGCANELGNADEARAILETYRYLYASFPDPGTQGSGGRESHGRSANYDLSDKASFPLARRWPPVSGGAHCVGRRAGGGVPQRCLGDNFV